LKYPPVSGLIIKNQDVMRKCTLIIILGFIAFTTVFNSCKKDDENTALKVGLVTGIGSLDDKGFNQQAYEGLLAVAGDVTLDWAVRQSSSAADIAANIQYFLDEDYDVIITLGYDAAQITLDAANAHSSVLFLLLDYSFATIPSNMSCVVYDVDEASFPCGFLAAWRAHAVDPLQPEVGFVAGPKIPTIDQFTVSYTAGVSWFNAMYSNNVSVSGVNSASFIDTLQGAFLADSLMLHGADVIFACAGQTGNGALYKVKEAGKTAIGVDTDQYLSIPQVGSVLLTSCMKRLDHAIYNMLMDIHTETFTSGQTITYNLANQGVNLAPYHDFDTIIPDSIKQAITTIKQGIMQGTIQTGW
jgi:basic membrane protein A